ncbi:NAD+ synthase [Alkalisalibacterium limincola]|uniref:Glutamine-dependent NAD(+) synthetase n=1 Tax=Alkalisalibacterium limincola TaxID=2699169 RepID=A0A5C8KZJ0_9GAMM|nr:NAD+ synthase [Alkalisalibacterium limincola]TXK65037.1 NAD+ synthase [Alkalisalibacterium limincola]
MSRPLRIALAQFDFPIGAVAENVERIRAFIAEARDTHHADLVLFPELAISGYPPEDLLLKPSFLAACEAGMAALADATRGIVAVVGHPQSAGSVVYNAASVLREGCIEHTYRKRELPNYAVFDERRYFARGGAHPCVVELAGVNVGVLVCEDLWHDTPIRQCAEGGAEVVAVINASPFERDKAVDRDALLAQRSGDHGVGIAYLNVVGGQDELVFDGSSCLVDGDGTVHNAARAFEEHWLVAEFDPVDRSFTPLRWPEEADESRESLAYRAAVRGTRDYAAKNGFKKVLLGLSGGIDSSLVLAMAVDAVGADNVLAVRLPSRYTADMSNDLAAEQAAALGVRLETIAIEAPFTGFLEALGPVFEGHAPDVTEENLQSRCRGALLMALSNKFGHLLLTTGNKSEYAVGYATIYGDMCGGYAPIKDLYKTEVYALSHWRNAQQPTGAAPAIPAGVIERAPSAELRENQTDQDSLPPYEVLDDLLRIWIDEDGSREDLLAAGHSPGDIARVTWLVKTNEWKRRQAAPGPKLSRRAFGRERRYPITSGWK